MGRPSGLAYDAVRGELLVSGDNSAGTLILRLGFDEDLHGTVQLPRLSSASTLAYDPTRDRLSVIDGADRLDIPGDRLSAGVLSPGAGVSIAVPELATAESATYDPSTGAWLVLDAGAVVRIDPDDPNSRPTRVDLGPIGRAKLVAQSRTDHLLYAMVPNRGVVHGFDDAGSIRKSFDLSSVGLSNPVAMVFAPTSDSTDDAGSMNLFIADRGDRTTLGGVTEVSLVSAVALAAPVDTATLVKVTATSAWAPGSPDPSGVTWDPGSDRLIVVDSEVDEVTGAGWNNVNLWRSTRAGTVVGVGAMWGPNSAIVNGSRGYSKEPTGTGYDPGSNTLFISDDSAQKVFVVKRGADGQFGTTDDIVTSINTSAYGATDTEDPELESTTGHLYILDGVGREIYRVNPVDAIFGNGNDVMTHFDISHLGPTDFEGLTSSPGRGTLYVGARNTKQIFEISLTGTLIRTISLSGISGLKYISGLGVAPSSANTGQMNLFVVDRAVDNGSNPAENDGKLFEISAPDIGGSSNQAPVAQNDAATIRQDTSVTVNVLANDTDVDGDALSVTALTQPANGTASVATGGVQYIPSSGFVGTDTFTYRASDGALGSNTATVTVTVTAPNQAPVAQNDTATIQRDTSVTVNVLANDSDTNGDILSVTALTQPANGVVSVATGGVQYIPNAGFVGTDTFTYRASDGALESNTATVTVTVTAPNQAPVARNDAASTMEDTAVTVNVL
ncbi:MAG: Ig-like domain-containing protein, partial [Ilumatobacteraceae bacterium]